MQVYEIVKNLIQIFFGKIIHEEYNFKVVDYYSFIIKVLKQCSKFIDNKKMNMIAYINNDLIFHLNKANKIKKRRISIENFIKN